MSVTRVPSRSLYILAIFCSSACCSVLVWVTRPSSIILHQGSALGRGVDLTLLSALYISPTSHPGFPSLHNVRTWNGMINGGQSYVYVSLRDKLRKKRVPLIT